MITNLDYYFSLKKFNDFCKGNQCFLKSHLEAPEECSRTSLVTHCNSMSRYKLSSESKHFSQWEVTFRTLHVRYGGEGALVCPCREWKYGAAGISRWDLIIARGSTGPPHCAAAVSFRPIPKTVRRPCRSCIILSRPSEGHDSVSAPSLNRTESISAKHRSITLMASHLPMDFSSCADINHVCRDVRDTSKAEWL